MEIKDSLDPETKDPDYSSMIPERVADNLALGWLGEATGDKFVRISGGITTKGSFDKYNHEKRREFLANLASRHLTSGKNELLKLRQSGGDDNRRWRGISEFGSHPPPTENLRLNDLNHLTFYIQLLSITHRGRGEL